MRLLLALALLTSLIAPATAQTYPNAPVRLVVPFSPAGPTSRPSSASRSRA